MVNRKLLTDVHFAQNCAIARALTRRYAVALMLVAALSTAAWISLRLVITEQQSTAAIVNVSGRQRMLSQRTALFANLLAMTPPPGRPAIRSQLQDAVDLMERSHRGLTRGDPAMGLPASHSPKVHAMYFDAGGGVDARGGVYPSGSATAATERRGFDRRQSVIASNYPYRTDHAGGGSGRHG